MNNSGGQTASGLRIWTISNGLSLMRLLLVIPFALVISVEDFSRGVLLSIMLLAYITDLLDGFIARKFGQESDFGRIIDPLADKIFVLGAVLAFLSVGLLPLWYVLVVILRDVCIFFAGMILRKRTGVLAQSNYTGKAAVLAVGIVLMMSLFRDEIAVVVFDGALLVSLLLMAASLFAYGGRFIRIFTSPHT